MQPNPLHNLAAAIREMETSLGVRYPTSADAMLAELSSIVGTQQYRGVLASAHLLVSAAEVSTARQKLPASLLPFMQEEQPQSLDIYAFDLNSASGTGVVVWNDEAVADWGSAGDFLNWVRTFVPAKEP